MKCNYRSWRRPAHQIKTWQRCFQARGRETESFVHVLMQRTRALFESCLCLGTKHRETNFWRSCENTGTQPKGKLSLGNMDNGFTL